MSFQTPRRSTTLSDAVGVTAIIFLFVVTFILLGGALIAWMERIAAEHRLAECLNSIPITLPAEEIAELERECKMGIRVQQ